MSMMAQLEECSGGADADVLWVAQFVFAEIILPEEKATSGDMDASTVEAVV